MQYRDTQANSLTALVTSVVGGLSHLQLIPLDYPVVRGAQYLRRDENLADVYSADQTVENLFAMADIHLPAVEKALAEQQEVLGNIFTEAKVLAELVNEGLNVQENLDQLRIDVEDNLLAYSI
jgi:hypothetical protein